jgi:hypothetical protein
MPLAAAKPQVTTAALGGYFSVLASEPNARFYNTLRDRGAENMGIRWTWFGMVMFAVDFAVQSASHGTKGAMAEQVQIGMFQAIKACGVDTEQDLNEIEKRLSAYGQLLSRQAGSLEIGQVLADHAGVGITNPVVLFQLGQQLLDLVIDVNGKFGLFDICLSN